MVVVKRISIMKKLYYKKSSFLKGVSTLDAIRTKLKRILPIFLSFLILSGIIYGGHSILDLVDPSFNPQIQTNRFSVKQVHDIEPLADGKMLVAGQFNTYNREPAIGLVRLNEDATLDTSFNSNVFADGTIILDILPQSDGKFILRGFNVKLAGQSTELPRIIRVNSDGSLDTTFNYQGGGNVHDLTIDSGDRALLVGVFSVNGENRNLIRIHTDGSLDTGFQLDTNFSINRVATQNGKILVARDAGPHELHRFTENGETDTSFQVTDLGTSGSRQILIQPDNKILVLTDHFIQRLNENGGIDVNFTSISVQGSGKKMALSSNGSITTTVGLSGLTIRRFLSDGTPDSSFTTYTPSFYSTFGLNPDGSIIIGDAFNGGTGTVIHDHFIKLFPDGSPDPSFNADGIGFQNASPGKIREITLRADGKIYIAGQFDSVNSSPRFKIARLNSDSTLDESFQINTSGSGNSFVQILDIYSISVQADGKVIVSGSFIYKINGENRYNLVRLNTDGSIDPTFNFTIPITDYFGVNGGGQNRTAIQDDGQILVASSSANNDQIMVPFRLNTNGSQDATFNSSIFDADPVLYGMDIAIQPDGKILIGGFRSSVSGSNSFMVRLNSDGSIDQSFQDFEESNKEISTFDLLPDGKILIVKSDPRPVFENPQSEILRLNADGTIDNTFDAGASPDGRINAVLSLSTGKIFVGGKFTNFGGGARGNLAQLNPDGSLNANTYNLNDEVLSLAVDSEGRVLVGGSFTTISVGNSNSVRSYAARLIDSNYSGGQTRFDFDGDGRADAAVFNDTTGNWMILNSRTGESDVTRFGLSGDEVAPADFDGDGKADLAVFRPSDSTWYILRSEAGFAATRWGQIGDIPVPADYDGDGKADIAVWRPEDGVWYILQSSDNQLNAVRFGLEEDIPLKNADFDGDGKADMAVWRPSERNFYWLESGSDYQFKIVNFGLAGDIPVVADYNGDGKTDLVIFRPSEGNWYQYLTTPTNEYEFSVVNFGTNGDEPVAADYDGDGKCDPAVRRGNAWHVLKSSQGYTAFVFAHTDDMPVAASRTR